MDLQNRTIPGTRQAVERGQLPNPAGVFFKSSVIAEIISKAFFGTIYFCS